MQAETRSIDESAQPARLAELLPRWLELPVYRSRLDTNGDIAVLTNFSKLPFIVKQNIRDGFPHNFLGNGHALETLLANAQVELEHTSGTSEERTPVLFGRGWWPVQEKRALRLNRRIAHMLDEYPHGLSFALDSAFGSHLRRLTFCEPDAHSVSAGGRGVGADGGGNRRMVAAVS
jgi:hypothetical protein